MLTWGHIFDVSKAAGVAITAAGIVWWGSNLTSRVGYIETYGSPQISSLTSRVISLEGNKEDKRRLTIHVEEMANRIVLLESRITRLEERQQSVLDVLKSNGAKLDNIANSVLKHMQETGRNSR